MPMRQSTRSLTPERLARVARRLLDASTLCAIATISPGGRAHVNTAYFAWAPGFDLVWLSDQSARHSGNLRPNATAAIAVYDSTQVWGQPDRGIQLFGSAREVVGPTARESERIYAKRFAAYAKEDLSGYRWYRFRPRRIKLFDEPVLGAGVFVTATVRRGSVSWERTEIYHGSSGSSPSGPANHRRGDARD